MINRRFFGASTHLPKISFELAEREIELLSNAGISSVRIGFLWSDIEPEPGLFTWDKLDKLVERLAKENIEVLAVLARTPAWANSGNQCELFRFYPPDDFDKFAEFVKETVSHFRAKVKHWEIWNEPNSNNFWYPRANPVAYVEMLKKAYLAAKKADPECQILNGGIACCREYRINFDFMTQFFQAGGADFCDIINIHPYSGPNPPECQFNENLDELLRMMNEYHCSNRKIWLTELGTPLHHRFALSQAEQGAHVLRHYLCGITRPEVERVFWYDFRNDGIDPDCFEHNFGLVNHDYSLKTAYLVYKTMTARLNGNSFRMRTERSTGGTVMLFERQNDMLAVLWAKERQSLLLKEISFAITAESMTGNELKLIFKNNTFDLTLDAEPIYLCLEKQDSEAFIKSFDASVTLIGI